MLCKNITCVKKFDLCGGQSWFWLVLPTISSAISQTTTTFLWSAQWLTISFWYFVNLINALPPDVIFWNSEMLMNEIGFIVTAPNVTLIGTPYQACFYQEQLNIRLYIHKHIIHSEGLIEIFEKLLCTRIWSLKYMKHLKQMKPMRQTMPTMTCIPRGASQRLSSLRWTNIPNGVLINFPKNTKEFIRKSNTATRGKLPPHPYESFMDV